MSFYGEQWLAHPYPLRQYPTINSPAHQDNFHVYIQRANAILCDVQEEGSENLPEVSMERFVVGACCGRHTSVPVLGGMLLEYVHPPAPHSLLYEFPYNLGHRMC